MKWLSPRLASWASTLGDTARVQTLRTSELPFIYGHVALMPDAHLGVGSTVGSVIATRDVIMPAAVGVDIGCGVCAVRTQLTAADLPHLPALAELRRRIEAAVPVSMGGYRAELSNTAPARIADLERRASRNMIPDAYAENWRLQLGTLGSGNHFIEICLDELDRVWVFLHSGSRGVGNRIARRHIKTAQDQCERRYITLPHRDLAYLCQGEPEFWDYLRDLRWAQAFAAANRAEMVDQVIACMAEWSGGVIVTDEIINTHHNYTEQETHYGAEVWVTRKGAINAETGRRGLIPGSMGTCSYVVTGKGCRESFRSAPHGAGRNFSRTEARKRFTVDQLRTAMEGIEWRAENAEAFLDEIPGAYKPIDRVMADAADLVAIDHTLRQILNVKGD